MSDELNLQEPGRPASASGMQTFGAGMAPRGQAARTSKLAIASLVFSLICFFPIAFILSIVSLVRCSKSGGQLKGKVFAIVALCISIVSMVVVPMMAAIAIPSLLRARSAANQFAAIACLKSTAMAQEIYIRTDHDGDGVMEYAQNLGELGSAELIDASLAKADPTSDNPIPKVGYYFRILSGLGGETPGAPRDFMQGGNMTGGYAVVAFPAKYDATGRNTFIILSSGAVYQSDLGQDTESVISLWKHVNMDADWVPVE